MKILILAVTTLNFVIYFPYNGSQEIHSKRKQHFSANPPLSNYTASNTSSILETEENSPTEDSNSYLAPLEGIVKITGSPSEGNRLEMIRANLHNFPPSGNNVLHRLLTNWTSVGFAYAKGTVDNPTKEDSPKSNAPASSDAIQGKTAVSSFAPSSQITQRRRRKSLSKESGISFPASVTHYQVRVELSDVADLDRDSEITQSYEHFPSIGRTEAWFASDSATNMQNSMEFIALADEGTIDTSSEKSFLRTGATTNEEAEQEDVFFIDSTAPIEKGIVTPRRRFGSLIDREMSSEEKSTVYTEVESESEEDVFQETEDIPSSDNLNHFELGYSSFERDEFLDSNTANFLSKLIIIPYTEITTSDRDLFGPEEENVDALYVNSPINKEINFKPMATKTKINSLDVSSGFKKNVDIEGDVAVSTPSNSVYQIERMGYFRPLNTYYNDISKPIIIAIKDTKDSYVTWKAIKNKQLSSTMDNGDITDLRNGYQMPTDTSAKSTDRPANKRTTARNEARNSFHVNTGIVNNNLNNEKEKVKLDLPSIIADSPIKKYLIKINDFETLKRKPSDLGSASSGQSMNSKEETIFIADSNDPFSPPQATNSVKKLYRAAIMAQKTYSPNNITTTASKVGMISGSRDAENTRNSQRYETENSFKEDATLNYEADLQNEKSIESEEDGTFEKENIKYYIYVLPMKEDTILKEDRLDTTHYSINPDAYDTTTPRQTSQPRAGQSGFQNNENVVSKPLFGKLNPKVQRKMIATDTNSNSNHDEISSETPYRMIRENVPSIYTFTLENVPEVIRSDSSIPMRGDVNSDKAMKGKGKTNFIVSFNLVNVTKMPPNANILFPYPSALESKEGNDNSGTSAPTVENVRTIGLKALLIPKQKISRPAVALGGNDRTTYSAVMSQVSEPTEEYWTSIDQNWKVIDDLSAAKPFSQGSPVPLEDLMFFPEKIINVADIHTTENGDNSDDPDSMAFSPDRATQAATHSKRGINKAAGFGSHHVQQTGASPPAEERNTSGNKANSFSSNAKAVVEEKFYISGDNIPVNSEEINATKATPLLPKPVVASAQQEGLANPEETFYPGSIGSTAQLSQVQARDSLALGSLYQQSTDSDTKGSNLPRKMAFSLLGFTKNKNSKSDPALIIGGATTEMTDNSFIPDGLPALSDIEVPSTDDAAFTEDLNNILDGEKGIASVKQNDMTQNGAIPFMEDSSAELHMEPEVGENKANYMDLTTIGLDESTLEFPSNENIFYALEEERSPTIRKPTNMQGVLHRRIGSPVPFPSTHVSENPSKENLVESKSEQKYNVWILRGTSSDSGNNGTFVQYLPALFYNKPSRLMTTHFLTNQNGKFSPKISDGLTLKGGSISRREGEDTENINTSDAEQMAAGVERRGFPSKISVPTMKSTTVIGRGQFPRKGLSSTAFNVLWEANGTMPPKSENNENKASRENSYNSRDITVPSYPGSINTESESPFVYEDSEAKFLKESSALSHIKKTNTSITSLSSAESNEWRGVMTPEENARSGEPLLLLTTETINLSPEDTTKHSILMRDKPLSDYSESESEPTDIIEYIDRIGETNNQYNQVIRRQKDLHRLTFTSTFPHQASANAIRNSIKNNADSSSTMEKENMSEMAHSQDSSIPLTEFGVVTNDGFSILDNSKDQGGMVFLPFSPMNTMNIVEDALILDTESSYGEESVLLGEDNRIRGSLAQPSSEKHGDFPHVSTEYLETSGQMTNDFLTNTPAVWSDILETKADYINFINDENVFIADSNVHFNAPQAKNPVKKHSLAAIMTWKIYSPNNITTTAPKVGMTADSRDAENTLNSPRYETRNSFEDDAMLNYVDAIQSEESIESEEDNTLDKENINDYIYVVPMGDEYIRKEDRLATTHYSTNPNVYDTTIFRGTLPPRAGKPGFENVVSKHWLGKLNPEVQRKMIARNTNSDSNYDERVSDTTYRTIQENIPNIYAFTQETVPEFTRSDSSIQIRNNINPGKAVKARSEETLIDSFSLVNVTKMPPNDTILLPYPSALESKEGNDNSGTSAPTGENVRTIGLKALLIPKQKISRPAVALGGNDRTSYSAVMSQVSEPTEEYWTSIDEDWKVIDDLSAAKPFSQGSLVPLEDLMFSPEKIINVADIHTTENGDNSDDPDSMAFSSDRATQAATHSKRGINKAAGFGSHHVQQTGASPPAEERNTLGNKANSFSSNAKAVVEEKIFTSADNISVNLEEINPTKTTPLLPKPAVTSAQQEGNGRENPGETFYPGSTQSTAKLTQVQARDSLPLGNLDQTSTDSYTKGSRLPMKMVFSSPGFKENNSSKLLTTESIIFIPEDLIKNFVSMGDNPLSDVSEGEPEASDTTVFMNLINESDSQTNQVIRFQTGLKHLMLKSRFPHKTSVNAIRNSKNNAESSSAMKRENVSEMTHSRDSSIPLTEFPVIINDGFSFGDDSEDVGDMASLPFSLMNAMHTIEDALILDSDGSYDGESVLPGEVSNRFKGSLALKSSAKRGIISDAFAGYHESSGPLTSESFTYTPALWSDTFETKTDYSNFINDEETVFNADSFVPFNLPQARNPEKKLSLASIMAQKTHLPYKTAIRASKLSPAAASSDTENTLNSPGYKSKNAVDKDAKLNYEVSLQNKESIKSDEDDTLEKNINDYIYIVPMEDDYILKEDRLAATHYSTNPDAYDTTIFRENLQPRAGKTGFENTENVVSKPQLGKCNPKVQRKMIATNTKSDSNHDGLSSDSTYRTTQENIPSIYTFTPKTVKYITSNSGIPIRGDVNPGNVMKDRSKENLIDSFNLVNVTKMPPNATILFPYPSALESKEGNDNSATSAPTVENVRPIGLKALLIPKQKMSRPAVALGGNDRTSYSAVMSQVSEPTEEYWTSIDEDWKVIDDPSAAKPFSQGSPVPLEDLMFSPEKIINVADIHTTENGDNSDDPDSMAFSPDRATQAATNSKRGINKAAGFGSHHVQQTGASPPAEERNTSGNKANSFSSNAKTVVEEKIFTSADNIPVNLEELNAIETTPLLPKPAVTSAQQEGNGRETPGETIYPGSTLSTAQLTQIQARDSLPLGNLGQWSTDSSTKGSRLPMKMVFSSPGFMENKSSKLLTTESIIFIPEDLIKNFVSMGDNPLSEASEVEPEASDITVFMDLINQPYNQDSQVNILQTGLNPLILNSKFLHKASANVISDSINNNVDSSSTTKSENMSEMTHSQDSSIPLSEFDVITNDRFFFLDDSEDVGDMASLPFSLMNTMHTMEDAHILVIDGSYDGESVLPGEDNSRNKVSLALKSSAEHGIISDASTGYPTTSDPLTSDFLTNNPAPWSDTFETMTDYSNFINDEETVFNADSFVPFNLPQARNPEKKFSLASIMAQKTYLPNKTTIRASKISTTAASSDAENTLNSPRYKSKNAVDEDAKLNYEASLQNKESIKSDEDDTLEEKNINDYIYIVPMEDDYILKEDRLATTHYSTNHDAYDTTTFRETLQPSADRAVFENTENVVSKHWLGKLNPEVQRKMIARNTNSDSNDDELFSDTTYRAMQENIPIIYTFTPETMPEFIRSDSSIPRRGDVKSHKAVRDGRIETFIASFNLVNVTKMPPNATILFPYPSALESKEGNDNSATSAPTVENVRPIGLKALLIPKQKISRPAVALGGNDRTSYSAVMSQVSEPTKEHWTSVDQNWKVIDDPSAAKPFSQGSPVPLEDLMFFPEKIINVANIHTTENGDNSDDPDSMAFSSDRATQAATHSKRGINKAAGFGSHHVQQTGASPPAEERNTSGNEANSFSSNAKAVVEEKFYISANNIPINLKELNATKATSLLPKPAVASAQQEGNGRENPGETFYPGATGSTAQLTQVQAPDLFALGNLDRRNTDSYTKGSYLPRKTPHSPLSFMGNKSSKLLTTESIIFIPEDLIKNFFIMGDKRFSYAPEVEPELSDIIAFMDLINEPDNQDSQVIRLQTG